MGTRFCQLGQLQQKATGTVRADGNWGIQGRAGVTVIARRSTAVTIPTLLSHRMTQKQRTKMARGWQEGTSAKKKAKE